MASETPEVGVTWQLGGMEDTKGKKPFAEGVQAVSPFATWTLWTEQDAVKRLNKYQATIVANHNAQDATAQALRDAVQALDEAQQGLCRDWCLPDEHLSPCYSLRTALTRLRASAGTEG